MTPSGRSKVAPPCGVDPADLGDHPHLYPQQHHEESIFHTMQAGPRPITTILVAKPDVVARHLGKLLKKVGQEGFRVVGMRLTVLSRDEAKQLVPHEDAQVRTTLLHASFLSEHPTH